MSKLLVFCIDALCASDIQYMKEMPTFKDLLERGALVEKIDTVFPALTYSCHTSILTGTFPGRHGILHNEKLTRGGISGAPWHSMKSDVKDKTFLDIAHENGLTTCSLSWPVSGGAEYDMNMPMIVPYDYKGFHPDKWLMGTATKNLMEKYYYKHGRYIKGPGRSLDLFTMALALDILEDFPQPDVMLVKMCDLDSARHTYGVYSQEAYDQLRMHDEQLAALMEAMRRKSTLDETNIVVLGDHGQTDIKDVLLMNVLLKQNGFLTADDEGNVTGFDAFCHSTGLAAFIEVRDPEDKSLVEKVWNFLLSLKENEDIKLNIVMDAQEAKEKYGLYGPFDFVIESALPISFGEEAGGDSIWRSCVPGDKKMGAATHGGSPQREEVTTFFGAGPNIKEAVIKERHSMVDEAPTMAAMVALKMEDIDGKPIGKILR